MVASQGITVNILFWILILQNIAWYEQQNIAWYEQQNIAWYDHMHDKSALFG